MSRGIKQIPKTEKEAERFQKLVAQAPLGGAHLNWKDDALWIESALIIDPEKALADFDIRRETYEPAQGKSGYSHIFLAAGYGIRKISPDLDIRLSRGQLSWANPIKDAPIAYGGYALNLNGGALVGATHDRLDSRDHLNLEQKMMIKISRRWPKFQAWKLRHLIARPAPASA